MQPLSKEKKDSSFFLSLWEGLKERNSSVFFAVFPCFVVLFAGVVRFAHISSLSL